MEQEFWQARWQNNEIGFHEAKPNDLLVTHFAELGLGKGDTVFVPLCGKALDLDWLAGQGLHVIGIELNQGAVEEVFARNNLNPKITEEEHHSVYSAGAFTIYVGDFFELKAGKLAKIDAVYDRAALVAMPEGMRERYAAHLASLTGEKPQLLISFDYDQSIMKGPPFSVPETMIREFYDSRYTIRLLQSNEIEGRLATRTVGKEEVWLLQPQ